jgi:hypothetical protein
LPSQDEVLISPIEQLPNRGTSDVSWAAEEYEQEDWKPRGGGSGSGSQASKSGTNGHKPGSSDVTKSAHPTTAEGATDASGMNRQEMSDFFKSITGEAAGGAVNEDSFNQWNDLIAGDVDRGLPGGEPPR